MVRRVVLLTLLTLAIAFLYRVIQRVRARRTARHLEEVIRTPEGFAAAMRQIAGFAVEDVGSELGIALDFTPGSVEKVEKALALLHDRHRKKALPDDELDRWALRCGAYIGEVIRRDRGGHWAMADLSGFDPMAFRLTFINRAGLSGTSLPVNWCGKRLLDGPQDNVWIKFRLLVEGDTRQAH